MSSHHVPSPSLLSHLARLIRPPLILRGTLPLQQQRPFSCSDECSGQRSTHAQSPRAEAAARNIGSSFAAAHYQNIRSFTQFLDVLESKWVIHDFAELDLPQPGGSKLAPQMYVLNVFLATMKNGWSPFGIAEWFSGTDPPVNGSQGFKDAFLKSDNGHLKLLTDPWIMGHALWVLGYQFVMSTQKVQRELGQYMVKVAVLMGNPDATLHVIWSHRGGGAIEPTPRAFATLNSLVEEGIHIEAMCLRAETLAWPKPSNRVPSAAQRLQAYELALKAFNMSEAGPPKPPPHPPRVDGPVAGVPDIQTLVTPAWLLLQRMGGADGKSLPADAYAVWEKAVLTGAREYDDPEACLLAIDPASAMIPVGSTEWIKFAMKAAMAGKPNASLRLGQYYLELHDWYPPNASLRNRNRIGFHWVEVSIAQMFQPPEIQVNAFAMALLLRENGAVKDALRWLDIGTERIEDLAKTRNAEAGECARTKRFFDECRHEDWYAPSSKLPAGWSVEQTYFPDKLLPKARGARKWVF